MHNGIKALTIGAQKRDVFSEKKMDNNNKNNNKRKRKHFIGAVDSFHAEEWEKNRESVSITITW